MFPICPEGRKTDIEKNPFHNAINISSELNPQTGQIAISKDTTETRPTTAPIGINFGLYSSTELILYTNGKMKLVYIMSSTIIVYPHILI
jgi:hypothetical protein